MERQSGEKMGWNEYINNGDSIFRSKTPSSRPNLVWGKIHKPGLARMLTNHGHAPLDHGNKQSASVCDRGEPEIDRSRSGHGAL